MKSYYFLAGLPRTGNTLLSSILNQNPIIYSSPLSPINGIFWLNESVTANSENYKILNDKTGIDNVMSKLLNNYYENIEKPVIIDREKAWGVPANFNILLKYVTPNPKIIFTTRPIVEILTSFINIMPKQNSSIDLEMVQNEWPYKNYLTLNDNRCEYLMRPNGQIDRLLTTINTMQENQENFCLVKYDDIINSPQEVMDKIYNFLELPNYKHDFNNIEKVEIDNDVLVGLPPNMHEIRPQLKKISQDPKEVLSKYIIDKYSNIGWEGL
jgi:sulfotransferase